MTKYKKRILLPTFQVEGKTNTQTVITEFPTVVRSSKFKELRYHFLSKTENGTFTQVNYTFVIY